MIENEIKLILQYDHNCDATDGFIKMQRKRSRLDLVGGVLAYSKQCPISKPSQTVGFRQKL